MSQGSAGQRRAVLFGLGFGLAAAAVVRSGAIVVGDHQVFGMDGAALFVTLGSALCGPKVALLIGLLGGLGDVFPSTLITVPWHMIGGVLIGWLYRRWVWRQPTPSRMVGAWLLTLLIYYPVVQGLLALAVPLLVPASVYRQGVGDLSPLQAYLRAMHYELPEIAFTMAITSIAWLALPKRARRPLTDPPSVFAWTITPATVRQRLAQEPAADAETAPRGPTWHTWAAALFCGLAALIMVRGNLTVPVPGIRDGVIDARELLVLVGSAHCGPLGAMLIGLLAGIGERTPGLAPFSAICHVLGAVTVALLWRRWLSRGGSTRLWWPRWLAVVTIYYVLVYAVGLLLLVPFPAYLASLNQNTSQHVTSTVALGVFPEYVFTLCGTTLLWWAAPRRLQRSRSAVAPLQAGLVGATA